MFSMKRLFTATSVACSMVLLSTAPDSFATTTHVNSGTVVLKSTGSASDHLGDTSLVTFNLPIGNYLFEGWVNLVSTTKANQFVGCYLEQLGGTPPGLKGASTGSLVGTTVGGNSNVTVPLMFEFGVTATTGTQVEIGCAGGFRSGVTGVTANYFLQAAPIAGTIVTP